MSTTIDRSKSLPFSASSLIVYLLFAVAVVVALGLRLLFFPYVSGDYNAFLSPWYDFIQSHGGFAALKYDFANYNPPYLYLLALATYLPLTKIAAIKAISVLFDLVLALFTYLILRLRSRDSALPLVAAGVMLFAPTVWINSAQWGQCDAIYASFCLGSLYFLLRKQPLWAAIFLGLALSFKLQAIFFLPVLLIFVLKRAMPWTYLFAIPLVCLLMLLPAYLAGRDLGSLLTVYVEQIDSGGVGGAGQLPRLAPTEQTSGATTRPNAARLLNRANIQKGMQAGTPQGSGTQESGAQESTAQRDAPHASEAQVQSLRRALVPRSGFTASLASQSDALTYNAPSIYQWFARTPLANNAWVGIGLAALVVALVALLLLISKRSLSMEVVMNITLVCVVLIPFLLPKMHERYFYLADVFTIVYAFYFPRTFYLPILMQTISLLSYAPFLWHRTLLDLHYVAVLVLVVAVIASARLLKLYFPAAQSTLPAPT